MSQSPTHSCRIAGALTPPSLPLTHPSLPPCLPPFVPLPSNTTRGPALSIACWTWGGGVGAGKGTQRACMTQIDIHVLITVNQPPTSPSLYRSKGLRLITKDGRDGHPIYRVGSDYGAGHRSPGLPVLIHEVAKEDEGPEDGGACHALPVQAGEAFQRLKAGRELEGGLFGGHEVEAGLALRR